MKRLLLILSLITAFGIVFSQTEISSFNATGGGYSTTYLTDYQCLGVNPANLGWTRNDHTMNLGFFETAVSLYSEPLTKSEIYNDLFDNEATFSMSQKENAADNFTDARLLGIGSVMWFGFSYQDEWGGIAFNIRDRGLWNSVLNDQASQFLFLGYWADYFDLKLPNPEDPEIGISTDPEYASTLYEGSDINFGWTREFNLGYGRRVLGNDVFDWHMGVGIKYILGYSGVQYYQDDDGKLVGWSALSPVFEVDYGEPTPSQVEGDGLKKVGNGFGFDIGTTFEYNKKLKVGLAVNDIGSITWNGNVYEGRDVRICSIESGGLDNYNVFEQGQLISADNCPDDPNQWVGLEERKVNLPMNFRAGASYRFSEYVEAGFDAYIPLKKDVVGAIYKPVFGIGARYDAAPWVQLSLSVVTSSKDYFGTNVPFTILFYPTKTDETTWTIGLGTRDMITLFSQNNPTVSYAFGFLRFSFGQKESSTRYLEQ